MIDLHCHVLPGIDDGPQTLEDSLALARAAAAAGIFTIVATPHVSWEYPNRAYKIARAVAELNGQLKAEGSALRIQRGAEIAMTRVGSTAERELSRLTLGHGRWLLLEPPFSPVVEGLDTIVADLHGRGYRVLLAHPERCPAFHRNRSLLERLVDSGVLASITAGSLDGRFGGVVRQLAVELVRDGLAHNVASDAHDIGNRSPSITGELERAGLVGLAGWLTREVPEAILDGTEIPPRPRTEMPPAAAPSRPRRWLQHMRSEPRRF